MKSVMTHQFSRVPKAEIPRSSFDRSHGHKTTFDAGLLIPIFFDEALPGDTFKLNMHGFGRLATPIYPLMDNLYLDTFFFSIPIRLLWDNWQKFNGEQENPGDSTDYTIPQVVLDNAALAEGSIWDYLGLPINQVGANTLSVSSLIPRSYNLVWDSWFRDQNMQDSVGTPKGDGPDLPASFKLLRRGKRHDYFTSCLPWPQKGPGVQIPLGTTAPITTSLAASGTPFTIGYPGADNANMVTIQTTNPATIGLVGGDTNPINLFADLTQASAATINSLRQAFQIQKIFERDARGGTRYTELIKAHFGVTSPDARLQRPEFLGGGSSPISVSPIPQTSASGGYAETPQGNLAAMGTVSTHKNGFTTSFTEHCIVLGLACVRADLTYQQGLNRAWSRKTRFDFYWPALAHIGEQAVLQKEIFTSGVPAEDDKVFGYQERFAEYRYKPSQITGLFRSTAAQSLDAWHLSQDFSTAPVLDAAFIEENPPVDRVIAVPSEPHLIMDMYFQMRCARPMPVYGVPGLIDHF